jgi:hypothetical protein
MFSAKFISQFILIFSLIILFGYCETKLPGTGVIVTLSTAYGLAYWYGYLIFPLLLVLSEVLLRFLVTSKVVNIPFFLLCAVLFRCTSSSDTGIKLRPYEKEIRKLLMKHDPSLLHKVDDMMARHRYHERELYEELKDQFSDTSIPSLTDSASNEELFDLPAQDLELVEKAKLEARQSIQSRIGSPRAR